VTLDVEKGEWSEVPSYFITHHDGQIFLRTERGGCLHEVELIRYAPDPLPPNADPARTDAPLRVMFSHCSSLVPMPVTANFVAPYHTLRSITAVTVGERFYVFVATDRPPFFELAAAVESKKEIDDRLACHVVDVTPTAASRLSCRVGDVTPTALCLIGCRMQSVHVRGHIYVFRGGVEPSDQAFAAAYDIAQNEWTTLPSTIVPRCDYAVAVSGDRYIWAIGGVHITQKRILLSIETYDIDRKEWSMSPISLPEEPLYNDAFFSKGVLHVIDEKCNVYRYERKGWHVIAYPDSNPPPAIVIAYW